MSSAAVENFSDSEDEDFVPDVVEAKRSVGKEKEEKKPDSALVLLAQKRAKDKAAALWEEMNPSPKKKAKTEHTITVTLPASSSTSRFAFSAPQDLINKAKEAKEATIKKKEEENETTAVYNFAGEKVEVKEKGTPAKKGNLDDLISSLQTRKLSSLQKSKMDWDQYKKQHNIEDELEYHKKDGYLEKEAFKNRTEQRVHELQKSCRTQKVRK